ncbi:MAG: histidine phosphatase family protein [Pseudomonadota bacterium]
MPITDDAQADIDAAVPRIKALGSADAAFLFLGTQTHRARQTAEILRLAIAPNSPEVVPAFALRNPDIHLAGSRVEMGSTAEFFAEQCEHIAMTPADVLAHPFYCGFLEAPDRIEFWVKHATPPGEDAAAVARRVLHFAQSFAAAPGDTDLVVACVTHSPVLRAILIEGLGIPDPGEPNWVEQIELVIGDSQMTYRFRDRIGTLPRF